MWGGVRGTVLSQGDPALVSVSRFDSLTGCDQSGILTGREKGRNVEQVKVRIPDPLNEYQEVYGTLRFRRPNIDVILASLGVDPELAGRDELGEFTGWCRVAWDRTAIEARAFRKRTKFRLCSVGQVVEFVEQGDN